MSVNNNIPSKWKSDTAASVDYYNKWFLDFAPIAFRDTRAKAALRVSEALDFTDNLLSLSVDSLIAKPEILPILRMSTCPPLARDRLAGLAGVPRSMIEQMEDKDNPRIPPRKSSTVLREELGRVVSIIEKMIDLDIFVWIEDSYEFSSEDMWRASTVVADRLCGADTNPIIRNEQERRQLALVKSFLESRGYTEVSLSSGVTFEHLKPGEFSFRLNVPGELDDGSTVNIPIDIVIKRKGSSINDFPLLFEAKSAGDFANVNKRRKEEANKLANLKNAYGPDTRLNLFLCGYFDSGYLGYEAAEGCDWVWEHRIDDLALFGI